MCIADLESLKEGGKKSVEKRTSCVGPVGCVGPLAVVDLNSDQ